ncbi:YbaB/EbfC family nucleoid-associated protein [Micromonospora sp. NPDC050187]|uniref:YbaB/EbfC family nucleoid-associated protein n=1 Tax=Micromonospora sp. NPDC050187 TaxID=3364277 RepID=UPI00379BC1CA
MNTPNVEDLERVLRDSERRMQQLSEVETMLAEVTSRYDTEDGMVSVELGADGLLRQLEINSRAMRLDSFTLAELITEAFNGAQRGVQEAVAKAMSESLGTANLGDVLGEAQDIRKNMDGMLESVSRAVNDAIVQTSRFTNRR